MEAEREFALTPASIRLTAYARAKIERDQIGFPIGEHCDRRSLVAEMAAVVDFRERCLNRPVATIDDEDLWAHASDRPQRIANLLSAFHLIVKDVLLLRAKAPHPRKQRSVSGRAWVGKERDAGERDGDVRVELAMLPVDLGFDRRAIRGRFIQARARKAVAEYGAKRDFGMIFVFRPL